MVQQEYLTRVREQLELAKGALGVETLRALERAEDLGYVRTRLDPTAHLYRAISQLTDLVENLCGIRTL